MAKVVVAGGSGFMGTALVSALRADGDEVLLVGRGADADVRWDDPEGLRRAVDGAELVVNLAGRSVNCRYDARHRAEILDSRVATTTAIGAAIAASEHPTPLWLNASTATIYRHADESPQTESSGMIAPESFSEDVAVAWEAAFDAPDLPATRRIALRTTIVLGDGSALTVVARLARLGLGGPNYDGWWPRSKARQAARIGHWRRTAGGRQKFSWIHLDDFVGVVRFLRIHPEIDGPVNLATPTPSDNRGFMAAVRHAVGAPFGLPTWRWMTEVGAVVIRTETELVLKSRWVLPERLVQAGYAFHHTDLETAIRASLHPAEQVAA